MPDTDVALCDAGTPVRRPPQARGGFVFWSLIFMGLAAFAPSVILPEWREYQALRMTEQREQHRVDALQGEVDRERRLLEAVQRDPAVIARLAQRDLRFHRPGEQPVVVPVSAVETAPAEPFAPTPVSPSPLIARALSHLPDLDYDGVFCDEQTRPIIMVMSVSLIAVALALQPGRASRNREQSVD